MNSRANKLKLSPIKVPPGEAIVPLDGSTLVGQFEEPTEVNTCLRGEAVYRDPFSGLFMVVDADELAADAFEPTESIPGEVRTMAVLQHAKFYDHEVWDSYVDGYEPELVRIITPGEVLAELGKRTMYAYDKSDKTPHVVSHDACFIPGVVYFVTTAEVHEVHEAPFGCPVASGVVPPPTEHPEVGRVAQARVQPKRRPRTHQPPGQPPVTRSRGRRRRRLPADLFK